MSRVGKMPVAIPQGVDVAIKDDQINVKGTLGALALTQNTLVTIKNDAGKLTFVPANDSREANAMSGTMRQLVNNMVTGVTRGFEKKLNLVGVGYKAQAQGTKLNLTVGYSHPVVMDMPAGIKVETPHAHRGGDQGVGPSACGPDCRGSARGSSSRALQGQGHPLFG